MAGDIVYVGAGTYRELLTVDVSGTVGNPIQYVGDYLGTNTDGVGGIVRITGAAADDLSASRGNCISGSSKNYRNFTGFLLDTTTSTCIALTSCQNCIFDKCISIFSGGIAFQSAGASQLNITIQNCILASHSSSGNVHFTHTVAVDNAGHLVQNCILLGTPATAGAVTSARVGGITVKNTTILSAESGIRISTALTVGQTVTVNNCQIVGCNVGMTATAVGEIVEDYNNLWAVITPRTNTSTGANSTAYPALFDARWFFQMVFAGAGPNHASQVISPFDLASYSPLVNLAGTSPTTTDMRGTAVLGAQREWGALEFDSTLKIAGGSAGGGGSVFGGRGGVIQ